MIYPINHLPDKIPIGIQTEQGVEVIGFDLKPWLDALPDMAFTVWHTRPGEKETYPVNDHMMVGTVLYWHPDGYDTAIAGDGKVEIAGVGENRRKLSGFAPTAIQATSLGATKEPGESVAPWYEAVLQAAKDIKADVDVGAGGLFLVTASRNGSQYIQRVDRTQTEIREAVASGKTCMVVDADGRVYSYLGERKHVTIGANCPTFIASAEYNISTGITYWRAQVLSDGSLSTDGYKPAKTPNPYKLTIKQGAESIDYDGSKAVMVEIPDGGTVEVDATLTKAGTAADAKVTGDKITELSEEMANKKGLTSAQITALDNMFKVCAYATPAATAYAAFCSAFGITGGGDTGGDAGGDTTEASVTYKPELDGVLSAATNAIIPSTDYWFFRTDYIPLAGYSRIKASYKLNSSGYGVAFFDDGKNIMKDVSVIGADASNYNVVEMDAPVGAAYCMLGHYGGVKTQEPDVADAYITLYGEGA